MSFSISLTSFNSPALEDRALKPIPQPTSTEQMHQLASDGEVIPQIAANLGLPVATVDSTLAYSVITSAQSTSAAALAARLSFKA